MLRSRFFWKLFLAFAGLALLTTAGTGFLVHQQLQASLRTDLELELLGLAQALSPFAEEAFVTGPAAPPGEGLDSGSRWPPIVQQKVVEIGRDTNTRITLVAADGEVIADSRGDPASMENHGDRPEIVAAASAPYGASRRFSQTLQDEMQYVALVVRSGDRLLGTIRLAIPLSQVDAMLSRLRWTIGWGAALGVLLAMGAGLAVAHRITSPLTEMTLVAEQLYAGAYDQRVESPRSDEFGRLGATLNRLADELTKRIATLAHERTQLDALVSGLHEGVIAVDDRDRLILSNDAANRFLQLRPVAEATDGPFRELADVPAIGELMAVARAADAAVHGEVVVQRDGAELFLDARATPLTADGETGAVVVLRDVTNLRRLETMRTDFVANVSHELKTPLTAIAGFVDTLLGGAIHEEEYNVRFLGKIERQVLRLDALVSDLLSLARIESVDEPIFPRPVGWLSVVREAVERFRDAGELEGLTLEVEAGAGEVRAVGEVEMMTQVFDNLLGNAIRYTPSGGSITVRTLGRGDKAVLEVEDTGVGISAADRGRIFERFFRADKGRSRGTAGTADTGGTGLGLAIVKHLVQRLDGDVEVESELGRGSLFRVALPLADPAGGAAS